MKKTMIAAAIVCAAAFAQAASINWSISNNTWAMKSGNRAAQGTTVYLINAAAQESIVQAITGGTFSESTAGVLGSGLTSNTKGNIASGTKATSNSLVPGTSYNYSYLVFDTTSEPGSTYYYISGSMEKAAYDPADETYKEVTSITFGSTQFNNGTGWTKVGGGGDVPEPTSAMLLVLGVAGLALRRRRT